MSAGKKNALKKKALTMTELVLVVITVGVVVAFGATQYQDIMKNARQKTAKLNLNLIQSAQEFYFDKNLSYYPMAAGTADVAAINSNLKLAITADVLGYTCTFSSLGTDYDCQAKFPATGAADWYCQVTKDMPEAQCY